MELNTQKLAENKYLCPLSGKKFKGPEFVRKHIFNKHMDKVEAFKQEVSPSSVSQFVNISRLPQLSLWIVCTVCCTLMS